MLYGKSAASNTEVLAAAETANAMEFINSNDLFAFDESAQGLIKEMNKNKAEIVALVGENKFKEEMDVL